MILIRNTITATALTVAAAVALAGCSSGSGGTAKDSPSAGASVSVDSAAREMLPDSTKESGVLHVATTLFYPPLEFKGANGEAVGMDIDLVRAVAAKLGLEAEIKNVPFESSLAGLTANRYDMSLSQFTITAERLKTIDIVSFFSSASVVTVLKPNETGITGPHDLCGHTVGVITGSNNDAFIDELDKECTDEGNPAIDISRFPSQSDIVQAVLNKRIEARLDDEATGAYINQQTGDRMETVGERYKPSLGGFAFPKNTPDMVDAMQAAMQSLIDDGTYGDILAEWDQTAGAVETADLYSEPSQVPSEE